MIVPKQPNHTDVAVLLRRRNHCTDRRESEDSKPEGQTWLVRKGERNRNGKEVYLPDLQLWVRVLLHLVV